MTKNQERIDHHGYGPFEPVTRVQIPAAAPPPTPPLSAKVAIMPGDGSVGNGDRRVIRLYKRAYRKRLKSGEERIYYEYMLRLPTELGRLLDQEGSGVLEVKVEERDGKPVLVLIPR